MLLQQTALTLEVRIPRTNISLLLELIDSTGLGGLHLLSIELLNAELQRRDEVPKPSCGTLGVRGSYNTPLHVFALALILALSTLGQYSSSSVPTGSLH